MSVTKTIAENTSDSTVSPSQRMSWELTFYSDNVQVVDSENFSYGGDPISATISNSYGRLSKNRAEYDIGLNIKINETQIGTESFKASSRVLAQNISTNNKYKAFTLTKKSSTYTTLHAYDYWNVNNPTTKNIATTLVNSSTFLGTWYQAADETTKHTYSYVTDTSAWTLRGRTLQFGFPPVVETPTVTKNTTKWLKGLTHMFVSVPITYDADATTNTGTAQYGGYVTSIKLEVGSQSNVYTFTEETKPTTTQVIPLYLNAVGTFTPKVTVTDSRGLSTTVSLAEIEVLDYENPSVNMTAVRCDEDGKIDDDGHNALVTATINYTQDEVDLTEPSIDVEDSELTSVASTATWYTTYTSGSGVSNPISDWATVNDGDTVYGVVDCDFDQSGALSWTDSYNITMLVEDTEGGMSAPVVQRIPISYYTIDVKARGKEIAFGAPANDDLTNYPNGLFKCAMDALMKGNTNGGIIGEIKMYGGSTTPSGWVFCDGSALSRVTYSKLFDVIGDTYGAGDGSTTFNVPDMRARAVIGTNNATLPNGQNSSFTARDVNATGGVETVTLTAAQSGLREHNHTQNSHDHGQDTHHHSFAGNFYIRHGKDSGTTWVAAGTNTTITTGAYSSTWAGGGSITSYSHKPDRVNISGNTGNTTANTQAATATNIKAAAQNATSAHNNMPPFIAVNYMIFTGVF